LRYILGEKCRQEGFAVFEARDGEEGLQVAIKTRPDILLLDMRLPKIDGVTVLKTLRSRDEYGQKVPVILLTNMSPDGDETINTIEAMLHTSYILKATYSLKEIVNKIKELLSQGEN
jgi:DNA-binding response OmpR family regulator